MKLKKIVSLALAGVLAVSMLTACGDKGSSNSSSSEAPVATGMVGKVIAALDTDKVEFTTDSSLQNTLNVAAANAGETANAYAAITGTTLTTLNKNLGSTTTLPAIESNTTKDGTDSKATTYVFTVSAKGTDEEFIAETLASKVAAAFVYNTNKTIADLPSKSNPDSSTVADATFQFNFDYTGTMAVVSSKDAATGEVTYVLAVTITRTPTKVEYSKV